MHVQLNIKRKIRKYVCYILKGMVNGMIKALTHEFRQMEGFFNHKHRWLFKAIVIYFHEFPNFQTTYLKIGRFILFFFRNIIIFSPKIRIYNYLLLRDVIFLLKKTLPRFTICIENMKHSFSQSCMRHKPRTASAVHSCFSFL